MRATSYVEPSLVLSQERSYNETAGPNSRVNRSLQNRLVRAYKSLQQSVYRHIRNDWTKATVDDCIEAYYLDRPIPKDEELEAIIYTNREPIRTSNRFALLEDEWVEPKEFSDVINSEVPWHPGIARHWNKRRITSVEYSDDHPEKILNRILERADATFEFTKLRYKKAWENYYKAFALMGGFRPGPENGIGEFAEMRGGKLRDGSIAPSFIWKFVNRTVPLPSDFYFVTKVHEEAPSPWDPIKKTEELAAPIRQLPTVIKKSSMSLGNRLANRNPPSANPLFRSIKTWGGLTNNSIPEAELPPGLRNKLKEWSGPGG